MGGLVVANMFGVFKPAKSNTTVQNLIVKGSTSVEAFMKALKEKLKEDYKITLSAQGSGTGISALFDKNADIAMSSRDLKPEEETKSKKEGIEKTEIAKDGISVIVNKDLPVANLSQNQITDIYIQEKLKTKKKLMEKQIKI